MMAAVLLIGCTSCEAKSNPADGDPETPAPQLLGAMSPQRALEYMKTTDNLIIVDVASKSNFERKHFTGAINIPIEDLDSREQRELYLAIPAGRPVILHCRLGMIVPGAYRTLKELRSDIPAISYIDGAPLFDAYNDWLKEPRK